MTKNQKIWIGVGAAVFFCLIVCGVSYFAFRTLGDKIGQQIEQSDNPEHVSAVADKIASYKLPAGYTEQMAMDFGFYRTLALVPANNPSKPMIMLMGYNQSMGANSQQMQEQMQRSLEQQSGTPGMKWTTVDEHKVTIRGQEVNVVEREAQIQGGYALRQLFTIFEGKNGTVMIMIQGDTNDWDQKQIDEFLSSIQ